MNTNDHQGQAQATASELINTAQAAKAYGISQSTLRKWRCLGEGPRFTRIGRAVRYRRGELDAFVEGRNLRQHCASGCGVIHMFQKKGSPPRSRCAMNTDALDLYNLKCNRGGVVYARGRRWLGPGPGHSRRDTSLSVWLTDDGRPLLHSFAGDSFGSCAAHLGIEHPSAAKVHGAAHDRLRRERQTEARRRKDAALSFCERVWRGGVAVEGTIGAKYLEERGIGWFPADVLFHPATPRGYASAATAPSLLALARSVTGTPKALQATFLTPDGRAKLGRVTFGALLGAAVRLSPVGPELAIGEGLETCASYGELEGFPTWATLGTANLEAFRPPSCVRRLIIAADGDPAGMKAAHALTETLRSLCDVTIAPAPPGADWNDVATGRANV